MPVLGQIGMICLVALVSEVISSLLPFVFPSGVLGMLILLVLLACKTVQPKQIKETTDFFLDNMPFFFIPVCCSILKYAQILLENIWAILLISGLTTPLVMVVTGHTVQLTMKWLDAKRKKQNTQ